MECSNTPQQQTSKEFVTLVAWAERSPVPITHSKNEVGDRTASEHFTFDLAEVCVRTLSCSSTASLQLSPMWRDTIEGAPCSAQTSWQKLSCHPIDVDHSVREKDGATELLGTELTCTLRDFEEVVWSDQQYGAWLR